MILGTSLVNSRQSFEDRTDHSACGQLAILFGKTEEVNCCFFSHSVAAGISAKELSQVYLMYQVQM